MGAWLSWPGILRLGLVQTALGAIVVLTTSTMNRVMVVEWALPAMLPGALVGLHYAVQLLRPRFGYGSDVAGRRTPWVLGGMVVLALGGFLAAVATAWMGTRVIPGVLLATLAFLLIGAGVGASGTSLLALLAKRVSPQRRAAAAALVWLMMIVGFILTAGVAGHFLDPFSAQRLVLVAGVVCVGAVLLTIVALWGMEADMAGTVTAEAGQPSAPEAARLPFRQALRQVWEEPQARLFTAFVFVSMLAYSMQDLILEPFAGIVFGLTPGQSTQLSGLQHSGVLAGMLLVGFFCSVIGGPRLGSLRFWTLSGCVLSALALLNLVMAALNGPPWPLHASVFLLGLANGAFAVSAIGSMMDLAGQGQAQREGTRMGLWGAAQAIAFGLGGFLGTLGVDVVRALVGSPVPAYAAVFTVQAGLFLWAMRLMASLDRTGEGERAPGAALKV
jgi:BCD family chlorophyll transporter-like MFS transporter